MSQFFASGWENILTFLKVFFDQNAISHIIDVLVVAFLIYKLIQLVRETRAESLVKGFILLAICYGVAWLLNLKMLITLVTSIFQFGIIALMIVFQPELRRALEQIGRSQFRFFGLINGNGTVAEAEYGRMMQAIDAAAEACVQLKRQKMGALIVFERRTHITDVIDTGTLVGATPTTELLVNLFFNKAPLHDGAVVMRDATVYAAGCILPLSQDTQIDSELGTRHRAALGMSEASDAVVVVVSEETGTISIARNGMLTRNFTAITLKATLETILLPAEEDTKSNIKQWIQGSKRKKKDERKEK